MMTPILRFTPGERVLLTGEYSLVGHYGEDTGAEPRWFKAGQHFPFVTATTEFGELWFVLVVRDTRAAKAA
jgi:hypothetical protein